MCGILGGTKSDWDYDAAVESMRHRGPDSQKVVSLDCITLGFARLSIIDLRAAANQPMQSACGHVWITFNGEVYGFDELRKQLIAAGHKFQTTSDTEVVLNAYLQWGDDFIDRLDGMFAIALYDNRDRKLRLYRDRAGIKPLYYFWDGKEFAYASELKGLTTLCRDHSFQIDNTAIYDFLTYYYIPEPKSLYRNVFKLPPAHRLVFRVDDRRIEEALPYWRLEVPGSDHQTCSLPDACEQLRALVDNSVAEQLIADVPVGFFLSGGMDSSVLVASASTQHNQVKTYSIGFDTDEKDETEFAREIAIAFNTDHHERTFPREEMTALADRMKSWYDEPFGDRSAFPTFVVSRFAKESVTVALSGDGGDELFGGYRWYSRYKKLRRFGAGRIGSMHGVADRMKRNFPTGSASYRALQRLSWLTTDRVSLYAKLMGAMTTEDKREFAQRLEIDKDYDDYWHFRKYWRDDLPLLTRLQYVDFHTYLPGDILTKVDRVSMAVSLEVRVPFLSRDLIEFAFSLPESVRYQNGELKGLMKAAYTDVLPNRIINRGKQGFSIPRAYKRHVSAPEQQTQVTLLNQMYGIFP
ncbi:MAG: asparagine synthase (glutamine-hydrolyzing) [Rubripirellula sp.]|nr:asparagine synthase (glutamine-hydrolyzing) [Rubripirellula sp.]